MNSFSDFGIKIEITGFIGEKIKIAKILGREIIVNHYEIKDSKCFKGKCLKLQITFNNEKRIVFTSGTDLIVSIERIPKEGFPFTTEIIEENERFKFT